MRLSQFNSFGAVDPQTAQTIVLATFGPEPPGGGGADGQEIVTRWVNATSEMYNRLTAGYRAPSQATPQPVQMAPVPVAPSITPNVAVPIPAPVLYRNNPDGSTSVVPAPDLSGMVEIDPATALTATYVPPRLPQALPAEKPAGSLWLLGLAALSLFAG